MVTVPDISPTSIGRRSTTIEAANCTVGILNTPWIVYGRSLIRHPQVALVTARIARDTAQTGADCSARKDGPQPARAAGPGVSGRAADVPGDFVDRFDMLGWPGTSRLPPATDPRDCWR